MKETKVFQKILQETNKCSTQVEVHRETNMNSHRRKEQQQIMQTSVYSRLTEVVWSGDNEGK